jgi:drug/metabolite transporter (DMT)-like permease
VILVARPLFLFTDISVYDEAYHAAGVTAGLLGAVFSAIAYTSVRKVTMLKPGLHAMVHVLYVYISNVFSWFGFVSSCVSPILMILSDQKLINPSLLQWSLLISVGFAAFAGQLLLNRGLQLGKAGVGTQVIS